MKEILSKWGGVGLSLAAFECPRPALLRLLVFDRVAREEVGRV